MVLTTLGDSAHYASPAGLLGQLSRAPTHPDTVFLAESNNCWVTNTFLPFFFRSLSPLHWLIAVQIKWNDDRSGLSELILFSFLNTNKRIYHPSERHSIPENKILTLHQSLKKPKEILGSSQLGVYVQFDGFPFSLLHFFYPQLSDFLYH